VTDAMLWLVLATVIILGVVAAIVLRRRLRRRGDGQTARRRPPDRTWLSRPQPGEIWWAEVPFEEGTGGRRRPCLVVRTYARQVDILKITSNDGVDHIEIPIANWDQRTTRKSYLDLANSYRVPDGDFFRRAGIVDRRTWRRVRRQYDTGFVI
jgi:hypothetical protein